MAVQQCSFNDLPRDVRVRIACLSGCDGMRAFRIKPGKFDQSLMEARFQGCWQTIPVRFGWIDEMYYVMHDSEPTFTYPEGSHVRMLDDYKKYSCGCQQWWKSFRTVGPYGHLSPDLFDYNIIQTRRGCQCQSQCFTYLEGNPLESADVVEYI